MYCKERKLKPDQFEFLEFFTTRETGNLKFRVSNI